MTQFVKIVGTPKEVVTRRMEQLRTADSNGGEKLVNKSKE